MIGFEFKQTINSPLPLKQGALILEKNIPTKDSNISFEVLSIMILHINVQLE